MATWRWPSFLAVACAVLLLTTISAAAAETDDPKYCACDEALINRPGFPEGFIFGAASSAYQVEGAYDEDGKGPSLWDHFTHTYPDKIIDHSNGDVAVDSYHLYKEDVKLLKDEGFDAYRFSVSWARILPGGTRSKGVNQFGIDYYNNLINELLANGIQPMLTIYHYDPPQALQDAYGGQDFLDFADLLFEQFGDRVKYWITVNEPWIQSYLGYILGVCAPGRCSPWLGVNCPGGNSATEPYMVTHNQILAHAATVKLYRDKYQQVQKGKIGITVNSFWFVPYDQEQENLDATDRAFDFMLGWVMEPVTYGRYPRSMRSRIGNRLPKFTQEEASMIKGSFDFIGLNYYSAMYARNLENTTRISYYTDVGATFTGSKNGTKIGDQGSRHSFVYNYPKGLRGVLRYLKEKYNDPLIYITENGTDEDRDDSLPISELLKDYRRQKFFLQNLCCLREAIEQDGVNVKGYFAWALTDNFEWSSGYAVRYGLNHVDMTSKNLERYPKYSAQWFKGILAPAATGKALSQ